MVDVVDGELGFLNWFLRRSGVFGARTDGAWTVESVVYADVAVASECSFLVNLDCDSWSIVPDRCALIIRRDTPT